MRYYVVNHCGAGILSRRGWTFCRSEARTFTTIHAAYRVARTAGGMVMSAADLRGLGILRSR